MPQLSNGRVDFKWVGLLLAALFLFYPELFLGRVGALTGDHQFQHYPWGFVLADSLKHFRLPFWTDLVQCGFPLVAEGQVGAFYPINWILYLLLPFNWAYSYTSVVHFFLSGLWTYLYAKNFIKGRAGAFFAVFIYLFGAGYGGAYYNITSLKTLTWFPAMLFFFERYLYERRARNLIFLSLSIAMALLAGYLQIALISILIFLMYSLIRLYTLRDRETFKPISIAARFVMSVVIAFILASPQLILSYQLALLSNRVGISEDYAYVGSMSPLALTTYFFPAVQSIFRGNNLYLGVLSLFFIFYALAARSIDKSAQVRIWVVMWVLAFLLALGEWSPLYVVLIKLTHFYSFRTPAKFLIFMCFAGAMLAGIGFQALISSRSMESVKKEVGRAGFVFVSFSSLAFLVYGGWLLLITRFRPFVTKLGKWYINRFLYGRAGHPHSLESYYERLQNSFSYMVEMMTPARCWIQWAFIMIVFGILAVSALRFSRRLSQNRIRFWLCAAIPLIAIDLYAYSFFDIKRDFAPYQFIERIDAVSGRLLQEVLEGKVARVHGFGRAGENLPIAPSLNMVYDFADIGVYSPFVLKRYHESIGLLGNVNDSNLVFTPQNDYVLSRLHLLSFLNVSHIMTTEPIQDHSLELLARDQDSKRFLYKMNAKNSRFHVLTPLDFASGWNDLKNRLMQAGFDPRSKLLLEESERSKIVQLSGAHGAASFTVKETRLESNNQRWVIEVNQPCFFVVSDLDYPGWTVSVDGFERPILKAFGLFRAVELPSAGTHEIEFKFSPDYFLRTAA